MRDDAEPPLSRSSIPLFQHVFSHEIVLLFRIVLYAKSAIAETRRDLVLKGKGSNRALERAPAARFDLVFPVSSASSQPLLPPPPPPPPPALTLSLSLSLSLSFTTHGIADEELKKLEIELVRWQVRSFR